MSDVPVVINCRDRVTALRRLVDWLERAGHERIILLDNASTYEPLLDYLHDTPHTVVWLTDNYGSRALWAANAIVLPPIAGQWFVYTDPDIVPTDDCPLDAVEMLRAALELHPEHQKAALGLHLEDVPANMPSLDWEIRLLHPLAGDAWRGSVNGIHYWRAGHRSETANFAPLYDSLSDTTFALYRPNAPFTLQALRTGWPYQARHECVSWYGGEPSDEDRFYLARATSGPMGSSWKEAA